MDDYTEIEDYDCHRCEWSLHVEKVVWDKFDNHQMILDYIQDQVLTHAKQTHGVDKSKSLFPVDKDINIYRNSPYVYYSNTTDSPLKDIK
jgi:hypothetical protein